MVWLVRAATDRNPPSLGGEDVKNTASVRQQTEKKARIRLPGTGRLSGPDSRYPWDLSMAMPDSGLHLFYAAGPPGPSPCSQA